VHGGGSGGILGSKIYEHLWMKRRRRKVIQIQSCIFGGRRIGGGYAVAKSYRKSILAALTHFSLL
jgi:hypothetical protein